MPAITLEEAVRPAIEQLAAAHLKYLRGTNPQKIAEDILRNPYRSQGSDPSDLAQSRIMTSRHSKIGLALGECCYQLASRHEGAQVRRGSGVVSFEYWSPRYRLVVATQSRENTLNGSVQNRAKREELLSTLNRNSDVPNHAMVIFAAEDTHDAPYQVSPDGIINVAGNLAFHWLSGDPDCSAYLRDVFEARLSTVEIRVAERRFRHAVELALLEAENAPRDEVAYNRARRDLEALLGPVAPVLVERPEPVPPVRDFFDMFDELDSDAAEE